MNSDTPLDKIKEESSKRGKDSTSRKALAILLVVWLLTLVAFIAVTWSAYSGEKEKTLTLAQQIDRACTTGQFENKTYSEALCSNAKKVIEQEEIPQGIPGPRGFRGAQGVQGIQGIPGRDGDPGPRGPRGLKGDAGKPGKPGKPGSEGVDGLSGSDGSDGAEGAQGPQGPPGPEGPQGPQGPQGEQGVPGDQGPSGPSGVVNVRAVNCDGPVIQSLSVSYDAQTRTITITCR